MADMQKESIVKKLQGLVIQAFDFARAKMDIERVFNDAAEGEGDGSGASGYHAFGKGVLPGAREAAMVDGKQNVLLRNMRANSAQFTTMHLSKG